RYDLVVAIAGGFSKLLAVITYATGIPRRIGFVPAAGHALDFCFNVPVAQPASREHQIERCLRLAEALGLPPVAIEVGFPVGGDDERYARETMAAHGLHNRGFVLYNASSSRPESSWPAAAIAHVAAELGLEPVLERLAQWLPTLKDWSG